MHGPLNIKFHVTCYPSTNLRHQSVQTNVLILLHNAYNSVKPCLDPGTWSPASHRRNSNQFQAGSHDICCGRSVIRTGVCQNTSVFPCYYHSTNNHVPYTEDLLYNFRVLNKKFTQSSA